MADRLFVHLDVFSADPLCNQLYQQVKRLIENNELKGGTRLPSIRELARQLQISTVTVRESLKRLGEDGLVVSRQGAGNYVRASGQDCPINSAAASQTCFTRDTFQTFDHELMEGLTWSDEATCINDAFNETPFHPFWDATSQIEFRAYKPVIDTSPARLWQGLSARWSKQITRGQNDEVQERAGRAGLRRHIADWLFNTQGIACLAEEIVIVSGAQQGRFLLAQLLANRCSSVVFQDPASITDLLAYTSRGCQIRFVRQATDGLDWRELPQHLSAAGISDAADQSSTSCLAHFLTQANFPSGAGFSAVTADAVLEWAAREGVTLVEDNYGAPFYYGEVPASIFRRAMERRRSARSDRGSVVFLVGSLSQLLFPSCRIGYVVIPEEARLSMLSEAGYAGSNLDDGEAESFLEAFVNARDWAGGGPSYDMQLFAEMSFESGFFQENAQRLLNQASNARAEVIAALSLWPAGLIEFEPVRAGFQQPVWFREDYDDLAIFEQALAQGLGVLPLSPYFFASSPRTGLSLGFVQTDKNRLAEGLERLLALIRAASSCRVI